MQFSEFLDQRPWIRLLQILGGVVFVIMTALVVIGLVNEHMMMRQLTRHEGELVAATIQGSLSESLAVGDNEAVEEQFADLRVNAADVQVFVFDHDGSISFSTEQESIGGRILDVGSADKIRRLAPVDSSSTDWEEGYFQERIEDESFSSVVRPIHNAPRCHHCHGASRDVLGGIMVRSSTERAVGAIRTARNINIGVGILGLVVAVLVIRGLLMRAVRSLLTDLVDGGEVMASSAAELTDVFHGLNQESKTAAGRCESIATSVTSLNETLGTVAVSMEQTSTAADSIAVSVEQLTASIGEIARESAEATRVTGTAIAETADTVKMLSLLDASVKEISSVSDVIDEISSQIDLLALNATIESARVGKAGRGFAVVAAEVKKLARATSDATESIRGSISGVQASTEQIVARFHGFSEMMDNVGSTISTIALAVEEQAAVTNEIAANVGQSSSGVRQATADVSSISTGLEAITDDMTQVNTVSATVHATSSTISDRAEGLADLAATINQLITKFRI